MVICAGLHRGSCSPALPPCPDHSMPLFGGRKRLHTGVTLRQTRVRVASGSQNGQVDQVRFAVFARVGAPNAAAAVRCGAQRRALLATPLLQPLLSLRALCRCCSAAAACCGL